MATIEQLLDPRGLIIRRGFSERDRTGVLNGLGGMEDCTVIPIDLTDCDTLGVKAVDVLRDARGSLPRNPTFELRVVAGSEVARQIARLGVGDEPGFRVREG